MGTNAFFMSVEALGIPEVNGLVSSIEHDLRQDLRVRLKQAAKLVEDEAKSRTHSKRVRGAITSTVEVKSSEEFRASIGPLQKRAFFAHFLEFGTKGGPKHHATRAFPFLVPAIDAVEDEVVDLVGIPPTLGGGGRSL